MKKVVLSLLVVFSTVVCIAAKRIQANYTEELKASNPMLWVNHMNNIRNRAEEIVLRELVYGEAMV